MASRGKGDSSAARRSSRMSEGSSRMLDSKAVLTEEEIDDIRETFAYFDSDHDDLVRTDEIIAAFELQGPTEHELQQIRSEIDPTDSGVVRFPDFLAMMAAGQPVPPELLGDTTSGEVDDGLAAAIELYDVKRTGFITLSQVKKFVLVAEGRDRIAILSDGQLEELVEETGQSYGLVNYNRLIKVLRRRHRKEAATDAMTAPRPLSEPSEEVRTLPSAPGLPPPPVSPITRRSEPALSPSPTPPPPIDASVSLPPRLGLASPSITSTGSEVLVLH
eukprot:PLAT4795.1.p1 GENE.PLAT4795.1~~PLAT4795.1.p1  ORF type:complete len:275 (+),score=95.67 PLAT4795.1:63-887(+)